MSKTQITILSIIAITSLIGIVLLISGIVELVKRLAFIRKATIVVGTVESSDVYSKYVNEQSQVCWKTLVRYNDTIVDIKMAMTVGDKAELYIGQDNKVENKKTYLLIPIAYIISSIKM